MRRGVGWRRSGVRNGRSIGFRGYLLVIGASIGLLGHGAFAQDGGLLLTAKHDQAAAELRDMSNTARSAINNDNCVRKSIFVNRLWEIRQDGNHPFWVRHDMAGDSPSLNAARRQHLDFIFQEVAAINQIPCPRRAQVDPKPPNVEAQIGAGAGFVYLPRRGLLGSELGGVPSIGLVTPDRHATGGGVSGSLRFNDPKFLADLAVLDALGFHGFVDSYLDFMFFYGDFGVDESFGVIDPGAGARLLIPGPTGGASGFSLGGNPLNVVRDARYSADLMKSGGAIKFGQRTAASNGLSFGVFGSAGYARLSFDEMFSGSIPGFARSFAYDSSVNVDQARLRVGAELSAVSPARFLAEDVRIRWGASAEVGPDFSHGSGSDRLSFTGFPDSSIGISKSKTDFGFSTGLSVGLELSSGVKLGIEGRYTHETGLPVLVRDGTNPTRLELESGDAFIGMARVTVPLGDGLSRWRYVVTGEYEVERSRRRP